MSMKAAGLLVAVFLFSPVVLLGQNRVVIVRHGSTPEGDIIRARADAALLFKQAELTGEKAYAKRLDNLMKECDVVYKRFSTRNKIQKEALENKFERTFDIIRFNQQLADIRSELEQKGIMQRTRIGDTTDEMNSLLEKFARRSITVAGIPAMKTELSSEQLDAIFLTDGANTFSGKTGKTRLEAFKWPFVIQRKEFQQERNDFDASCDQALKEINEKGSPSPETISDLLKQADAIDQKLDSLPLSDSQNVRAVEIKWRKEAKAFVRELTRTLGNTSMLDSGKLSKYVFRGKTLGELIDHLDSKGLRFSHPSEQDANLYASIFFIMRYASQAGGKSGGTSADTPNSKEEMGQQEERQSGKPDDTDTHSSTKSKWIDLLAPIDVARDKVLGKWTKDKNGLNCVKSGPDASIASPIVVNGEYDLSVSFTRISGDEAVDVLLPVGSHTCLVFFSGWNGDCHGIEWIDGKWGCKNQTTVRPGKLINGIKYDMFVKVRSKQNMASIEVFLNNKPIIRWQGNESSLSLRQGWSLQPQRIGFGTWKIVATFYSAKLKMISGKAEIPKGDWSDSEFSSQEGGNAQEKTSEDTPNGKEDESEAGSKVLRPRRLTKSEADDLRVMLGTWRVSSDSYQGVWNFQKDGTVLSSTSTPGKWKMEDNAVRITWNERFWETFQRPLNATHTTGDSWRGPGKVVAVKE